MPSGRDDDVVWNGYYPGLDEDDDDETEEKPKTHGWAWGRSGVICKTHDWVWSGGKKRWCRKCDRSEIFTSELKWERE